MLTKFKSYYIIYMKIGRILSAFNLRKEIRTMGDNVFFEFLAKYWNEIVAAFDKLYFFVKDYFTKEEA